MLRGKLGIKRVSNDLSHFFVRVDAYSERIGICRRLHSSKWKLIIHSRFATYLSVHCKGIDVIAVTFFDLTQCIVQLLELFGTQLLICGVLSNVHKLNAATAIFKCIVVQPWLRVKTCVFCDCTFYVGDEFGSCHNLCCLII